MVAQYPGIKPLHLMNDFASIQISLHREAREVYIFPKALCMNKTCRCNIFKLYFKL